MSQDQDTHDFVYLHLCKLRQIIWHYYVLNQFMRRLSLAKHKATYD